jgi:hypothetical protein
MLVIPAALVGFLAVRRRAITAALRERGASADLLTPLVAVCCLGLFWAVASGRVYWRPRYLLPIAGATAVHLGVTTSWLWQRGRPAAVLALGALLALNVAGTLPRLRESRGIAGYYAGIVRSLREKGVRNGYADFSLSAPVTMFTAEAIVLSPRLGPTPAYESARHARRVERDGPDAYVLRPEDDAAAFAATLRGLGVTFQLDLEPVPVFYALSRRVSLAEIASFPSADPADVPEE